MKIKKKNILFWSPSLSKVGTINAVLNAAYGIKFHSKNLNPIIIDSTGEWEYFSDTFYKKSLNFIKFYKKPFFKLLPKGGYFKSRLSYFLIFISSFLKLKKLITDKNSKLLVIHLITSLPLIIVFFFNIKIKIVMKISGFPKINFFRKLLWKIVNKKIFLITCPTRETQKFLISLNIFNKNKIKLLYDPFINKNEIGYSLKKQKKISEKNFLLAAGRLTKQKNFELLIKGYSVLSNKIRKMPKLLILGEGEQHFNLKKLIISKKMEENIILKGHVTNAYNYIKNCKCFILTSLWEDPGAVLVEASFFGKNIISSNCQNGPKEILGGGKFGFLFKNNDLSDFTKKYILFLNTNNKTKKYMSKNLKKQSNIFETNYHTKKFLKLIHEI